MLTFFSSQSIDIYPRRVRQTRVVLALTADDDGLNLYRPAFSDAPGATHSTSENYFATSVILKAEYYAEMRGRSNFSLGRWHGRPCRKA